MRKKLLIPSTSMAVLLAIVSAVTAGIVDDRYEERLNDLEARVARLEAEVGITPPSQETPPDEAHTATEEDNEDGDSGVVGSGSSSSSTSVQSSSSSYTATYSANGDRTFEFEIDKPGEYTVIANAGGPFTLRIETTEGNPVPAFTLDSETGVVMTASGELEPGLYTLRVNAASTWSVTVTSTGA